MTTRISVRVTPRASTNKIDGIDAAGALRVRVTAPPADGEANVAVTKLLAKAFGLPQRGVVLISGAASREKVFELDTDEDHVRAVLGAAGK
jgi:uncharacterized protein (TIGR00251 family)